MELEKFGFHYMGWIGPTQIKTTNINGKTPLEDLISLSYYGSIMTYKHDDLWLWMDWNGNNSSRLKKRLSIKSGCQSIAKKNELISKASVNELLDTPNVTIEMVHEHYLDLMSQNRSFYAYSAL